MNIVTRVVNKGRRLLTRQSSGMDGLDRKLEPYLNIRGGFFVEAGANNGVDQSNTLYFEKYRGWHGILVEPIPEIAAECRKNRPKAAVENCALVPSGYPDAEIEMRYCNLMSLVKGAMPTPEEETAHIRIGCEVQHIDTYDLKVPARTLTSVLDQHRVTKIDLLSLDVEGFEVSVLGGLDFNKYRPRFVLVEARFRAEVEACLDPFYYPVADLSHHDVLFASRT